MVLYFAKSSEGWILSLPLWFDLITIILVTSFSHNDLQSQITPFSSAYNAGLLSSDRFDSRYDAPLLQPAILPDVEHPGISANVRSHFPGFGIFALGLNYLTSLPGHFGLGLSVQSIGAADYHDSQVVLSIGRKLNATTGIGISQRFARSRIGNEGRPVRGSTSVGLSYDSGNWGMGLLLEGLMPWNMAENFHPFRVYGSSYFSWQPGTRLYLLLGYLDAQWTPVIGLRQTLLRNIAIYGAFRIFPARFSAGLSLPFSPRILAQISVENHPVLGWSPAVGLNWKLSDSDQKSSFRE